MSAVLVERYDSRRASAGRLAPAHLSLYRSGAVSAIATRERARARRRIDSSVYRRRRLLAAGLLMLAVAAVLVLVQLIQAGIGGGPLTTTGAAAGPGMIQAGASEYVVRGGDTLWSIAARLEPGRDPRPLVDQMDREVGGASLYPGEVIPVPAGR